MFSKSNGIWQSGALICTAFDFDIVFQYFSISFLKVNLITTPVITTQTDQNVS